jgi:hypothetical protein
MVRQKPSPSLLRWSRWRNKWVFLEGPKEWRPAHKIEPLRDCFPPGETTIFLHRQAVEQGGILPEKLRQFAVLSSLSNHELAQLIRLGELVHAQAGKIVIKRGDPGDALFFVLAGSVRVRVFVGREEKTFACNSAGEFFGDVAMFTRSLRSADVVAEGEMRLLRFAAESFVQRRRRRRCCSGSLAPWRTASWKIINAFSGKWPRNLCGDRPPVQSSAFRCHNGAGL